MKDPGFIFYPGDYLRDTQCLSEKSQVAYDRIMCEHMRNICISQQQLNFFTKRLTDEEKSELMFTLSEVSGGFQITWVAESIIKRREYSESRRSNRKKPNKKQDDNEESYDKDMKTYDKHMDNEIEIENVIKEEKKKRIPKEKKELIYPFNSEKFMSTWEMLLTNPKWKKKIATSLQIALNSLGKYQEEFSIELMEKAIAGDWQGVTFSNTPDDYQKWLNRKSVNPRNTFQSESSQRRDAAEKLGNMSEKVVQNAVVDLSKV